MLNVAEDVVGIDDEDDETLLGGVDIGEIVDDDDKFNPLVVACCLYWWWISDWLEVKFCWFRLWGIIAPLQSIGNVDSVLHNLKEILIIQSNLLNFYAPSFASPHCVR